MACVAIGIPVDVSALGLGSPRTLSTLGQPLNLLFPVSRGVDERLDPECVHVEVMAGDARVPPAQVKFRLEGDDQGVQAVRILSLVRIDEPIVSVTLSLGCPSNMTRQYVAFIDPPDVQAVAPTDVPLGHEIESSTYSPALRAALATSTSRPQDLLDSAASAPDTPAQLSAVAEPARKPAQATSAPAPAHLAAADSVSAHVQNEHTELAKRPPRKREHAKKPSHAAAETKLASAGEHAGKGTVAPRSRLQLDAPEVLSDEGAASAAASTASAVEEAMLLTRVQQFEGQLAAVQKDNAAMQARLRGMQSELDAAHARRYSNPLVWLLLAVAVALAGLCGYLLMRMKRMAQVPAWWQAQSAAQAAAPAVPLPAESPLPAAAPLEPVLDVSRAALHAPSTLMGEPEPVAVASNENISPVTTEFQSPPTSAPVSIEFIDAPSPMPQASPKVMRDAPVYDGSEQVTVEELLDMQQQVEFFLVLGQDQAAVELLENRVATGASSALPYLKLMEIYQTQGDSRSFGDVSERFARRFNAVPPTWGADLNSGRLLEDYPQTLRAVQKGWGDKAVSMALIQGLLTHGARAYGADEAHAPPVVALAHGAGFDLPAYRDLLLLFSVARDISERDVRGEDIDLFLPLDTLPGSGSAAASDMMATILLRRPGKAQLPSSIDVDISLDETPGETQIDPPDGVPASR